MLEAQGYAHVCLTRRHKTATERDLAGVAAKKERDAVPKVFEDETTGVHFRVRALSEAHRELNGKVEGIATDVANLRISSARAEGKLDILVEQNRVSNEQKIADIHDETDRKKTRRALVIKAAGIASAVWAAIVAALHGAVGC